MQRCVDILSGKLGENNRPSHVSRETGVTSSDCGAHRPASYIKQKRTQSRSGVSAKLKGNRLLRRLTIVRSGVILEEEGHPGNQKALSQRVFIAPIDQEDNEEAPEVLTYHPSHRERTALTFYARQTIPMHDEGMQAFPLIAFLASAYDQRQFSRTALKNCPNVHLGAIFGDDRFWLLS